MSVCKDCSAEIQWVHSEKGRMMPIDWEPTPDGNVVLQRAGSQTVAHVLKAGEHPAGDALRFRAHFASCPAKRKAKR